MPPELPGLHYLVLLQLLERSYLKSCGMVFYLSLFVFQGAKYTSLVGLRQRNCVQREGSEVRVAAEEEQEVECLGVREVRGNLKGYLGCDFYNPLGKKWLHPYFEPQLLHTFLFFRKTHVLILFSSF